MKFVNLWRPLCLPGGKQGNFQFVVKLAAHDHAFDLADDGVHSQQDLGAFHQMAAVGVAVTVGQVDVLFNWVMYLSI